MLEEACFLLDCVHVQQILEKTQNHHTSLANPEAEHVHGKEERATQRVKGWAYLKMPSILKASSLYPLTYLSAENRSLTGFNWVSTTSIQPMSDQSNVDTGVRSSEASLKINTRILKTETKH